MANSGFKLCVFNQHRIFHDGCFSNTKYGMLFKGIHAANYFFFVIKMRKTPLCLFFDIRTGFMYELTKMSLNGFGEPGRFGNEVACYFLCCSNGILMPGSQ